jgi:hypothetical protein
MKPQIKPLLVGLASPGLFWLATSVANGQDAPAPQGPPISAPTSPETYRVLLLSSGKVVRGEIIDVPDAGAYCLRGSGGPVPYPKTMVLKAAGSVEELYQFQLARLPGGDTDERIRLARWCLKEQLPAQAREQLEVAYKMCPNDREVQRMLYNLAASKAEKPTLDPEIRKTSVDAPAPLDPNVVRNRKRYNGQVQIFDLTPAQALNRANEFAQYVQPVLQKNCVKCHSEKYQGEFQLIEVRTQRDRGNTDILRANLDATLRLINQDDPSRSELLSAGLVPHGGSRNAIFKGPNDPGYQYLVTWIKRVRPTPQRANAVAGRGGFNGTDPSTGEGFATERSGRANNSATFPNGSSAGFPPLPGQESGGAVPQQILQSGMNIQSYEANAEFVRTPGDNPQFPAPFVMGGTPVNPTIPGQSNARPRTRPGSPVDPTAPTLPDPSSPSTQLAKPMGPGAVAVAPTDGLKQLPGMDKPLYPTPSSKPDPNDPQAPAAPAKKPKKIDNVLLEQIMRNRNGATTSSP